MGSPSPMSQIQPTVITPRNLAHTHEVDVRLQC